MVKRRRKTAKKAKKKTVKRKAKKKKGKRRGGAFGGLKIKPDASFAKIIGNAAVPPSQMTKKIWQYIKRKKLMRK